MSAARKMKSAFVQKTWLFSCTYDIQDRPPWTGQLPHDPPRLNVHQPYDHIITYKREQPIIPMQFNGSDIRRDFHGMLELCRMEVEELIHVSVKILGITKWTRACKHSRREYHSMY